jgi:glycosyltransferase involved in cell wall biosynthesis
MPSSSLKLIAFVANNSWSVYNFRLPVIQHLIKSGYKVLVVAPKDQYTAILLQAGCQFEAIEFNNRSVSPLADIRYFMQLKACYARYKPAVIFHFVAKPNIYGSLAAGALGIPSVAVITGLGYAFDRRNWLLMVVKKLYQYSLQKATEVWFLNKDDLAVFDALKITRNIKTAVLPGEGVDTGLFKRNSHPGVKPGSPFVFLMCCRLLNAKGIALYAEAAKLLKQNGAHIDCRLIGDYEKKHPDNIDPQQLRYWTSHQYISYLGFTNDVRTQLEQAHCVVLPSYYHEGVPRSLMEAASMELPVITSNTSGCNLLVKHQQTGYCCAVKNVPDLAAKMLQMIQLSNEERAAMGKKGRAFMVAEFDITKLIGHYQAVIENYTVNKTDL